jgi:hypothetical protein
MIIIAGDSWGEGCYQMDHSGTRWPGFHHYWNKSNGMAINVSYGGYSNHQSLSALEMHLIKTGPRTQNRRIILWLTCVLRDYPPNHPVDNIENWKQRHYENIFDRVIVLAHSYNCDIELLGGLGDIPRSFPEKLSSRAKIKLHSTAKFVNSDYSYEMPYGHITQVDRIPNLEQRYKLLEYIEPKRNYMTSRQDIYPDTAHFGATQYQQLYEFLK